MVADTYEELEIDSAEPVHRGYCRVKIFRDKVAGYCQECAKILYTSDVTYRIAGKFRRGINFIPVMLWYNNILHVYRLGMYCTHIICV